MKGQLNEYDEIILNEMISHPALFSHPVPKKIAIFNENSAGIVQQVLKHTTVTDVSYLSKKQISKDKRAHLEDWGSLQKKSKSYFDVVINDQNDITPKQLFDLLAEDGISVQLAASPFNLSLLKKLHKSFCKAGFEDFRLVNFPQPSFETGWRCALFSIKNNMFRRIREKDIFNKTFSTSYYNFDIHKAAAVLPEFLREELIL